MIRDNIENWDNAVGAWKETRDLVYNVINCSKPIVAAINGEGARVIEESGSGKTVPAGNGKELAQAIFDLYSMPGDRRKTMGVAGRHFFEMNFDAELVATKLIEILESRSGSDRSG